MGWVAGSCMDDCIFSYAFVAMHPKQMFDYMIKTPLKSPFFLMGKSVAEFLLIIHIY